MSKDYEVTLVGRKLKLSKDVSHLPFKTKRFRLWFNKGAMFYANYNLRLFFYLLFHKADLLLANDLDTLLANHWAKKFKRKCRLVYDSHEYFCGVPELVERPWVQKFWRRIEQKTVPKVGAMYTVSESIAALYRKEYHREVKVVRNISDFEGEIPSKTKEELGLPTDRRIVIMQGAGINIERGAEEAIEAIQRVENAVLVFVGGGDVIPLLQKQVEKNHWEDKVFFYGKRPYAELLNFSKLADIGLSLDKDTNINYRFSLPNKIFDFVKAGTPMLVSDLPEVRRIINKYDIGCVAKSHEPSAVADELNRLLANPALLEKYRRNMKTAQEELNWKNESKVLEEIYANS
jgi:glycosyltransferase involved in cell wall biosynthesis